MKEDLKNKMARQKTLIALSQIPMLPSVKKQNLETRDSENNKNVLVDPTIQNKIPSQNRMSHGNLRPD